MDERPTQPAPTTIHEIPWLRLFPALRLFRAPGAAADPKRLMLAALGVVLMELGFLAIDRLLPPPVVRARDVSTWAATAIPANTNLAELTEPIQRITRPFVGLFDEGAGSRALGRAGLGVLWVVAVWGLLGGAITRIAVVRFAKDERVGMGPALRYALAHPLALIGSPLTPLLGVATIALPVALFGLLYHLGNAGATFAGILGFVPLVGGLLLTLILVGLGLGWPLMIASAATEDDDGFDALSRTYAYVYQRPWHYAAYVLLAAGLGLVGVGVVGLFTDVVVHLAGWSVSRLAPQATYGAFTRATWSEAGSTPAAASAAWLGLVGLLVRAWAYSYFWTAAALIYLLLRRDVDGTPISRVAHESRPGIFSQAARGIDPYAATPTPASHSKEPSPAGEVAGA